MAANGIPFFLFRTGSQPATVKAGVRSMLAFWMGGVSSGSATPPTPEPGPNPGGRIVGGYFSRGRWRELVKAREAVERAAEDKRRKARRALERAAELARQAEQAAELAEAEEQAAVDRLTATLNAAANAGTLAETIRLANAAAKQAQELIEEMEEEEVISLLLLLH